LFQFAEKTKNINNTEENFKEFRGDDIFEKIISRINKEKLKPDDIQYIHDGQKLAEEIFNFGKKEYSKQTSKKVSKMVFKMALKKVKLQQQKIY